MSRPAAKQTRTDHLYKVLRADILAGRLLPGQRLKFPELCSQHSLSVSVVRETLTRLAEQGLVHAEAHQGFRVVSLSLEDLHELTTARLELEGLVLRRAVVDGDVSWEASVLAAHHTLERTPVLAEDDASRISDQWAIAHAAFHQALLNGCANDRLRSIALSLRDSAELYRRWSVPLGKRPDRDLPAEHRGLLEAAIAHDAELAAERLAAHILRTTELLTSGTTKSGNSGISVGE